MLHTKLIKEEPSKSKALSLSHPLSGLGARSRGDWLSEGRDRDGTGRDGRARSSGHRSGANLGAGVQLSPGAARNGGSHLASAVGMDQTES